jgi:hypothetical protein
VCQGIATFQPHSFAFLLNMHVCAGEPYSVRPTTVTTIVAVFPAAHCHPRMFTAGNKRELSVILLVYSASVSLRSMGYWTIGIPNLSPVVDCCLYGIYSSCLCTTYTHTRTHTHTQQTHHNKHKHTNKNTNTQTKTQKHKQKHTHTNTTHTNKHTTHTNKHTHIFLQLRVVSVFAYSSLLCY